MPRTARRAAVPVKDRSYVAGVKTTNRSASFDELFGETRGRRGPAGAIVILPGEFVELTVGYSEVCMHMRVAGQRMTAQLLDSRYPAVQLYQDGRPFSSPITPGEAGLYCDEHGRFYTRR